ncbi:unnamed protein product [Cylicostephanus goldi]|uniref:Uncharacterized protein n=1 Tax=Cylicostephanus goldi TaxID=71465 RepID=A0A3P6UVF9_CYLGO|nr:unnamed protein product [Cylicostephanus goldi]
MDYHCVLSGTDPRNVTIADLAIPDTMCSQKGEGALACVMNKTKEMIDRGHEEGHLSLRPILYILGGYECPDNMVCMKLDMSAHVEGFYGMFNDFGKRYLRLTAMEPF